MLDHSVRLVPIEAVRLYNLHAEHLRAALCTRSPLPKWSVLLIPIWTTFEPVTVRVRADHPYWRSECQVRAELVVNGHRLITAVSVTTTLLLDSSAGIASWLVREIEAHMTERIFAADAPTGRMTKPSPVVPDDHPLADCVRAGL